MKSNQPFNRLDKVNSLLLRELDSLSQRERIEQKNKDDIILSFTKVETSGDLQHARVFFTVMPEKFRGDAKKFLNGKARGWQKSLGQKITLKYIPKLQFIYDEGQQNAMAVEEILSKIDKER